MSRRTQKCQTFFCVRRHLDASERFTRWATEIIEYPRILQGWYMFAPEAPLRDENICVDAVTIDGRHVDPYNQAASSTVELPCDGVPAHLQQGQFFTSYSLFIPRKRYEAYHHLKRWILDYHERTGNPNDRIVSFKAYEIWDHSPPAGETGTRNVTKKVFLQHRAGSR